MNKFNKKMLNSIIESALLAPSADNYHRVRFQISDGAILMSYMGTELARSDGYKRILALLSLGALSENFTIAASQFGIGVDTILSSDQKQAGPILKYCMQAESAEIDPLWQFIPLRHTNRHLFYRGPGLNIGEQNEIEDAAKSYQAIKLVWLNDPLQRKPALHLMRLAETERFRNRLLHEELFSAIRFNVGWRNSCTQGLPPGALGVEPLLRGIFAQMRYWPVMRFANFFGAHYMLGYRSCYLPCSLAPDLGILAASSVNDKSVFDAGRAFQRVWLKLTQLDRVLQPMPASAIYSLNGVQREGVPDMLQYKLAEGWKGIFNGRGVIPLMLFRIGKTRTMPVTAGRKAVACYI